MEKEIKPLVLRCKSGKSRQLRLEMVIDMEQEDSECRTGMQRGMSLNDWLEMHCVKQTSLGKKSIRQIARITRMAAACGSKDIMLTDTDADFCKRLICYMKSEYRTTAGKPLRAYSVINYLRCFTHAMNEAVREGMIDYNPMSRLRVEDKVRTPGRRIKYLTIDEVRRLIKCRDC